MSAHFQNRKITGPFHRQVKDLIFQWLHNVRGDAQNDDPVYIVVQFEDLTDHECGVGIRTVKFKRSISEHCNIVVLSPTQRQTITLSPPYFNSRVDCLRLLFNFVSYYSWSSELPFYDASFLFLWCNLLVVAVFISIIIDVMLWDSRYLRTG